MGGQIQSGFLFTGTCQNFFCLASIPVPIQDFDLLFLYLLSKHINYPIFLVEVQHFCPIKQQMLNVEHLAD